MEGKKLLASQIARWGSTFPWVRGNATDLWEEANGAYAWFCEPGITVTEAHRRWALVVHLVHNFKSQVLIRQPAATWPSASAEGPSWPERPKDLPPIQHAIVERVDLNWRKEVNGFGAGTTTALLALLHPDEHAVMDVYTAPVAVSLALSEPALQDHSSKFATYKTDRYRHRKLVFYAYAYLPLLRDLADRATPLHEIERGLFLVGEHIQSTGSAGKGWPRYHSALLEALADGPATRD